MIHVQVDDLMDNNLGGTGRKMRSEKGKRRYLR